MHLGHGRDGFLNSTLRCSTIGRARQKSRAFIRSRELDLTNVGCGSQAEAAACDLNARYARWSLRSNVARRLALAFYREFRCRDHRGAARSITGTRQRGKLGPIST